MKDIVLEDWEYWKSFPELVALLRSGVMVVQVGANNGDDEIGLLMKTFGWKGMRIEPHRKAFRKLQKFHEKDKNVILENVIIDPAQKHVTLYEVKRGDKRHASSRMATVQKDSILHSKFHKKLKWNLEIAGSYECPASTLNDLLERHSIVDIDLLAIDAEAHDYEIIKSIDLDIYKPSIIIYEYQHLSGQDYDACKSMLEKHGYRIGTLSVMDHIAIKGGTG